MTAQPQHHEHQDDRDRLDRALHRARVAGYPPGGFVGQEGFMTGGEVLALARRAGVGPGVLVLDVCCGAGGPGRLITRELGCRYVGIDASAAAVALARARAAGLDCRFTTGRVPPLPFGPYDVVLLLETLLAFPDKAVLLAEVARVLPVGGRFAFTVEEGAPLTGDERAAMPGSDTVWPVPLAELGVLLERAGLRVRWQQDCTAGHASVAASLQAAYAEHGGPAGSRVVERLTASHRLWAHWLRAGRVRKYAVVAEKLPPRV